MEQKRAVEELLPPHEGSVRVRATVGTLTYRSKCKVHTNAIGYKTGLTKGLASNTTARTARGRVALQRVEVNALHPRLEPRERVRPLKRP